MYASNRLILAESPENIKADIEAIKSIDAVQSILEVVCRTTGMGFAAIARVTDDKWVACAVRDEIQFGLVEGGELKLETTICDEIRQHHQAVIIDHVDADEVYKKHHTPEMYGFQSYISVPIRLKDGTFFGTLCAIDPKPADLNNPKISGMFNLFSDLIAFHLNAIEQLKITEARLEEERENSELREQFIAILGHDLRNPVGAISNAAQLLLRMPIEERERRLTQVIQDSSYRIKGLVENMLDFAVGRMGGGIKLNLSSNQSVEATLNQVIDELKMVWPEREISLLNSLTTVVHYDPARMGQLFSNLLSNALSHGSPEEPVVIETKDSGGEFVLSISNGGDQIPDVVMDRLFQPFFRGDAKPGQQGLGLGLYIASEIANAHGGRLDVESTCHKTCFTLKMPCQAVSPN